MKRNIHTRKSRNQKIAYPKPNPNVILPVVSWCFEPDCGDYGVSWIVAGFSYHRPWTAVEEIQNICSGALDSSKLPHNISTRFIKNLLHP